MNRPPTGESVTFAGIGDEAAAGITGQIEAIAELGWTAIELRTVDGLPLARLDDAAFGRVAEAVAASGLRVVCVDSRIGSWARTVTGDLSEDVEELDILTRRCRALETKSVRIMSYPNVGLDEDAWRDCAVDRIRMIVDQAEAAGLLLLHENCLGWASNAERMLYLLDAVGSPALRLLFDTGNGVAHGYDSYELLERIVDNVEHVHVKDGERRGDAVAYLPPGEGTARVGDCLRLLLARGYRGCWSIEPHIAFRPEEGDGPPEGQRRQAFAASGLALQRLVREQVIPACPGWTADGAQLERQRSA